MYDYDLIVIGAGSGGVRAARLAANLGKKTALIEESVLGGTCVNRGCVPKKLMVYASEYNESFSASRGFGWNILQAPSFDWAKFMQVKAAELVRLQGLYQSSIEKSGVNLFQARAKFVDEHTVELDNGSRLSADKLIIAVGAKPNLPVDIIGIEHCITSRDALELQTKPDHLIIYGGGYIAVEFANIFHALGVKTTIVCRRPLILRGFDNDLRVQLSDYMQQKGIELIYNSEIREIKNLGNIKEVHLKDKRTLKAQHVLLALGRQPNVDGLGLSLADVKLSANGAIEVDEYLATSQSHIYAVGDVANKLQLAPVAIHEAICVIKTMFEGEQTKPDYNMVASAVFSQPELGVVGLSEVEAASLYNNLEVYKISFRPMRNIISGSSEKMFIKLLVNAETQLIVGIHIIGPGAAELIQLLAIAVKAGVTKQDFNKTMAVHPTASEELVLAYIPTYTYLNGIKQ